MTIIGVTGSVSSGKTTVAGFFKEIGAYLIDADKIVHRLYKTNRNIRTYIRKHFGGKVFSRGTIDRRKLARIVFTEKKKLKKLQKIVHPLTIKEIKDIVRKSKRQVIVIDAPLLLEANLDKFVDYIVVVKVNLKKQFERCAKKGFMKRECLLRQKSQMPLREKIKHADFVIDNNRSKAKTRKEVEGIWQKLTRR